jgi:hypothetical protein
MTSLNIGHTDGDVKPASNVVALNTSAQEVPIVEAVNVTEQNMTVISIRSGGVHFVPHDTVLEGTPRKGMFSYIRESLRDISVGNIQSDDCSLVVNVPTGEEFVELVAKSAQEARGVTAPLVLFIEFFNQQKAIPEDAQAIIFVCTEVWFRHMPAGKPAKKYLLAMEYSKQYKSWQWTLICETETLRRSHYRALICKQYTERQ